MKILELVNKVNIAITNEEAAVLDLFEDDTVITRQDLSPRQVILANQLVNKDILLRKNETGQITYKKKTILVSMRIFY
jgi:hypothetical protein